MMQFSANLGFLWADLPLPKAIHAAKAAGFHAVECHWPYATPSVEVKEALDQTTLRLIGLNTRRGNVDAGDNGLSALPGREDEAREAIREALAYAVATGAGAVHVMAGRAQGKTAHQTFVNNLKFASELAEHSGVTILIEPLNRHDAPGYFLKTTDQALDIIDKIAVSNVRLMFDCYHIGRTEGDLITRLRQLLPVVGHIQFASVPDRGTPDHGEICYKTVFAEIESLGWKQAIGAEYKPAGNTEETLEWLSAFS